MSTASIRGVTLSGLQGDTFGGATYKSATRVSAEIDAAKANFGATAVRLQIQQQMLVGDGGTQYDPAYKTMVDSVVGHALGLGLTVIINCQTENAGPRACAYPNQVPNATTSFWRYMAVGWNGNPGVIFDLFNEPDTTPGDPAGNWALWQLSFNDLIGCLRGQGITNQLWADADKYARGFNGCPGLTDPGANLVYSFHHPASGPSPAGWDTDIGNWAAGHPVVNGEFAQNATFGWGSAYIVQQYLGYLLSRGIGQTLWTVFGDSYFSDAASQPCGWWGNMIANLWNPTGWSTYAFRAQWQQNYITRTGAQLSWGQLYQGWSPLLSSMLASATGYNDMTARMAEGKQWRMHIAFRCAHANDGSALTVIAGAHGATARPASWPFGATTNLARVSCANGRYGTLDMPASALPGFAAGTSRGLAFGPGPSSDVSFQGHLDDGPQIVLEVHA